MNYGNKIFVYEGIPDIYFTACLLTDLMSGVTLRRYLLPDRMDNGNFRAFKKKNDGRYVYVCVFTPTHKHTNMYIILPCVYTF